MKHLRITFIHATDKLYSDTQMFGVHFMPVWAYTLAAHLEDAESVSLSLFDDRFESRETIEAADLFLFTGINQDYRAIVDTVNYLRQRHPQATYLIGGPIAWSYSTAGKLDRLASFDHIFIGDGEVALPAFIQDWRAGKVIPRLLKAEQRFGLEKARLMHRPLLSATLHRYYGGVLEVSRGCPFLCEFCDIRILPDNNRSHTKAPPLLLQELEFFAAQGVRQVLLACDNFIGDPRWAETVCDLIIQWRETSGHSLSLYTWLTIDVARHPRLLQKLRRAGFDMFFIGVESFHRNSLLETAKVQNTSVDMVAEIRRIQSYGFIVVAGLIFGFDTDPDDIVDITLKGILKSGLISGDPSLLTALPGTPLYLRMQLSGRLRDVKLGLGGFKYQTNICYLKPVEKIQDDFRQFVRHFNRGSYQWNRLLSFYRCLENSENYLPTHTGGYGNIKRLLTITLGNRKAAWLLAKRLGMLLASPERAFFILRAILYAASRPRKSVAVWAYFKFWLFNWSNSIVKYSNLGASDFDIDSVGAGFDFALLLPSTYADARIEAIPEHKIRAQRQNTAKSLTRLIQEKQQGLFETNLP